METLYLQVRLFLVSVASGIGLLFLYDFLRIYRGVIHHSRLKVFLEDYFFWLGSGFVIFLMLYQFNNGAIRSFSAFGIALGMWGYHVGPSTPWVCTMSRVLRWIIRQIKKILAILQKPFRFIWKICKKVIMHLKKAEKKATIEFNKRVCGMKNTKKEERKENEREKT
ncbi:MAG: hypothetical protein HFJ09_08715 [Lachnospiraceae bacterium]|nr:hypothetical protein [Lachnospiraceae bacterium]